MYLLNKNMMLSQVTNFLKKNKKVMYYLGFFAVVYFGTSNTTFAEEGGAVEGAIEVVNYIFKVLSILLGIITNFVGLFLNPSWTNGTLLGLSVPLKSLWILVSNVVYFIFAILIVIIAFMNIIGKGDKWELKQALPKFIIGVLMVPFSWFLVQLILSFSSILTASVLAIPNDVLGNQPAGKLLEQATICTHHYIKESENSDGGKSITSTCVDGSKQTIDSIMSSGNMFGILNIYTYGLFALDETVAIYDKDVATGTKQITDLAFKTIFNLLVIVVFAILVIALGLSLFVRGVWLWIYMIFSPVFGLLYFFGKDNAGDEKFSLKEFIALAMVPVYVAAALSFGLLFIFVAGHSLGTGNSDALFSVKDSTYEGEKTIKVELLGNYNLEMGATLANSGGGDPTKINQLFDGFKGSLGTLIMQLFGLAVLWISVMAALSQSKITNTVIEPIASFGKSVGGLIAKSPQYAPIFGGVSASGASQFGKDLSSHYSQKSVKTGQKLNSRFGLNAETAGAKADLASRLSQKSQDKETVTAYRKAMESIGSVDQMRTDQQFRNYTKDMADIFNVKLDGIDLKTKEGMAKALNKIDAELDVKHKGKGSILTQNSQGYQGQVIGEKGVKDIDNDLNHAKQNGGDVNGNKQDNYIDVYKNNDRQIVEIKLGELDIKLDENGKIQPTRFDEFAKGLNGLTYDKVKDTLNDKGLENFDSLFTDVQKKLGKDAIKVNEQGLIEIDLSKKQSTGSSETTS